MRVSLSLAALVFASLLATEAQAQLVSGNNNGNAGSGIGSSNGNGNGNGNGSNNTVSGGTSSSALNFRGRQQAPAIVAPGLAAAGIESCLGSTSVGGAGPGFGVTIGSTTTDRGCNLRLYSRTLYALGHRVAATQILCNDPDVAQALLAEGVQCRVGVGAEVQQAAGGMAAVASADRGSDLAGEYDVDAAERDRARPRRRSRRSRTASP